MIIRIMAVINMMKTEEQNLFMVKDFTNLGTENPVAVYTEILIIQTETGISQRITEINMITTEITSTMTTEMIGDQNILTPPTVIMIHFFLDVNLHKVEQF